jgi:predicted AAA+ superfamily ATPase
MSKYLDRLIDEVIADSLKVAGFVVIDGPKWCGKSTSAKRFAKTIIDLESPVIFTKYKIFSDTGDKMLLRGEHPIMFDEWQKIPDIWSYIRGAVDVLDGKGHFIITGSAKPIEDRNRHSGIGRMKRVVMRPLSLFESNESEGSVSIKELFENGVARTGGHPKHNFADIARFLCRGGWPDAVMERDEKASMEIAINYVNEFLSADIVSVDGIKRNTSRARQILRAYARIISSTASVSSVLKDVELKEMVTDPRTVASYINAYRKLYVIEDVEAWLPMIRSKSTIRSSATRQFVDPSIAAAVLGAKPQDLIWDLDTFGALFESLVVRDLRIYAEKNEGSVYSYHDSLGLKADAIIDLNNGKWGAVAVKLGGEEAVNKAAKNLIKLRDKIDKSEESPSFLLVITATGFAYRRPDGVQVVPIGCLKD